MNPARVSNPASYGSSIPCRVSRSRIGIVPSTSSTLDSAGGRQGRVVFIADLAEHLLQHVLERYQAHDGSEFIHYQRQVRVRLTEIANNCGSGFVSGTTSGFRG